MQINSIRINKFLSSAGVCSRREADKLISSNKVRINNKVAKLGDQIKPDDRVKVNGKLIENTIAKIYIAFHKPYGVITTTNPENENNIMEYVQAPSRVYPIGRLDVKSSGLILLTNDGDIVNKLLKSKHKQEKEYIVNVDETLTPEALKKLSQGVIIDGIKTLPATVNKISAKQFSIVIVQGRNLQIRKMCESLGYTVTILKRVRIAKIQLGDLQRGKWRYLNENEIASLKINDF